ncbi:hypothetical protein Py04_0497 [Pyrococcus sp. ST04]|nr:hypothetical protein Py04_0497 [Pyrococcus sp. ST04]
MERKDGSFLYVRGEREVEIIGEELNILPAPAKGYGVKLMMIRLDRPVAVSPGKRVEGFLSVPIEVSVRVGDVEIDRFSVGREKYALYGTLESGVIVRYARARLESEAKAVGNVKVLIENSGSSWGLVERIVFPLLNVMYYSREKAFYPLIRVRINKGVDVINTGEPPMKGLEVVGERKEIAFKMRW